MPTPLALSDEQLAFIMAAAHPLQRHVRGTFLQTVAQLIQTAPDPIGDGSLHRLVMKAQRQFFDPPDLRGAPRNDKFE